MARRKEGLVFLLIKLALQCFYSHNKYLGASNLWEQLMNYGMVCGIQLRYVHKTCCISAHWPYYMHSIIRYLSNKISYIGIMNMMLVYILAV